MSSLLMLRVVFVIIISIVLVRNVDVALAYSGVFTEWGVRHGADDLLMTGEPAPASEAATARVMSLIQTRTSEMGEASAAPRTSSYAALAKHPFATLVKWYKIAKPEANPRLALDSGPDAPAVAQVSRDVKAKIANASYCTSLRAMVRRNTTAERNDVARDILQKLLPDGIFHVMAYKDTSAPVGELFVRLNENPAHKGDTTLEQLRLAARPASCAVVGNSGHLLKGKALGAHIDTNDVVIRMNAAPTNPRLAGRVGAKSTLRLLNKHWSRSYSDMVSKKSYMSHIVASALGSNATTADDVSPAMHEYLAKGGGGKSRGGSFCKPFCPLSVNETVVVARGDGNVKAGMRMLDDVLWRTMRGRAGLLPAAISGNARLAMRMLLALNGQSGNRPCVDSGPSRIKSLSTGIIATLLAGTICEGGVRLYGFGGLVGGGEAEYQYHGTRKGANTVDHDFGEENKVYRFLKSIGLVEFCGGSNAKGAGFCTRSKSASQLSSPSGAVPEYVFLESINKTI